jgi:hypothetical protein
MGFHDVMAFVAGASPLVALLIVGLVIDQARNGNRRPDYQPEDWVDCPRCGGTGIEPSEQAEFEAELSRVRDGVGGRYQNFRSSPTCGSCHRCNGNYGRVLRWSVTEDDHPA